MQSFEIIPAATEAPPPRETGRSGASQSPSPAEQFDAFIGRALSRSSDTDPDDAGSASSRSKARIRPEPNRKNDSVNSGAADFAVGSNSARPLLQKLHDLENSSAKSNATPEVEAVGGPGQSTGSKGGSPASDSADAPSLAEQLRSLLPAGDGKTQLLQPELPSDPASEKSVPGTEAVSAGNPSASDEAVGDVGLIRTPTAGSDGQLAGEPQAQPAGAQSGGASGSAMQMAPPEGAEGNGISSAQHQVPMQKAEKKNEFSAPTEQKLPVSLSRVAGEELPTRSAGAAGSPSHAEKPELATTGSAVSGIASSPDSISRPGELMSWPSLAPDRSLERAHDLMSLHAFRLRDSGADALQVVIKPGTGLQLSLNLQMRDGNVEMRATLHRGDFDFLSRHWSQLQQQLESRGIRLAPLTQTDQLASGNNGHFQEPDRSPAGNEIAPGALTDYAISHAPKPATITRTKTTRGWESWA